MNHLGGDLLNKSHNYYNDSNSLEDFLKWVKIQYEYLAHLNASPFVEDHFELYFRGVSNNLYEDIPSIFRNHRFIQNEEKFLQECLTRNPCDFTDEKSTFDILVKMQHYGVPTRLLDITQEPLVALYFATRKDIASAEKGKVIAYFIKKKQIYYPDSPIVAVISNLARQNHSSWALDQNRCNSFSELLKISRNDSIFPNDNIDQNDLQRIVCVKPKMNNDRIIRQNGAFLLFGLIVNKENIPQVIFLEEVLKISAAVFCYEGLIANDFDEEAHQEALETLNRFFEDYPEFELHWNKFKEKLSLNNTFPQYFRNQDIDSHAMKFQICFRDFILTQNEDIIEKLKNLASEIKYVPELGDLEIEHSKYIAIQEEIKTLWKIISKNNTVLDIFSNQGVIAKTEHLIGNKENIDIQLSTIGITKNRLFPELEVLAETLKRDYR